MRRISVLGAAALLAALPAAASAQSQETVVRESTTVVVKEAPKPSPFTFTPYGFFLVNAYFNDAAGARNYPLASPCTTGVACEGNVLFDVRQSRIGGRLSFNDKAGWTGATLSALLEVDFNGGYTGAVATSSAGFYNPAVRLRKAYANAAWGSESMIQLRVGQDDRLISPLRPVSLAYVANPTFQNAGLLHGRAPMLQLRWDLNPKDGIAVSVAGAALNPQDNTVGDNGVSPGAAVDLGAGNRSRIPNLEGRVGLGWRSGGTSVVALGGWAGWQKNRYVSPATDTNVDANTYIFGGDLTVNVAFLQVMGEIYKAKGYDVPGNLGGSQGVALSFTRPTPTTFAIASADPVPAFGGWFQIAARPIEALQIYGGWGGTQSPFDAYTGTVFDATPATRAATRLQNYMWAGGVTAYAGKNWRFSAEYGRSTSYFLSGLNYTQGQFSINSMVSF